MSWSRHRADGSGSGTSGHGRHGNPRGRLLAPVTVAVTGTLIAAGATLAAPASAGSSVRAGSPGPGRLTGAATVAAPALLNGATWSDAITPGSISSTCAPLPDAIAAGAMPTRPGPLVAQVAPSDSGTPALPPAARGARTTNRAALLRVADAIVAGRYPRISYLSPSESDDPVRYLYMAGVSLRQEVGTLGYAYAATADHEYLEAMVDRDLLGPSAWPDWNPGHGLDTAQVADAVAIAASWAYPAMSEPDRATVASALREKFIKPMMCPGFPIYAFGISRGTSWINWGSVLNGSLITASLALGDLAADGPPGDVDRAWAQSGLAQGLAAEHSASTDAGTTNSLANGVTDEGVMYTTYEAAFVSQGTATAAIAPSWLADLLNANLPSLTPYALWQSHCGALPEPAMEDANSFYPWVDRALALAVAGTRPGSSPALSALTDQVQGASVEYWTGPPNVSTVTTVVPGGLAELVRGSRPQYPGVSPVGSYTPNPLWGCARSSSLTAWMSTSPNNATHAHQDSGNVLLNAGNAVVLGDLGQYNYRSPFPRSQVWRRATSAHSTLGVLTKGIPAQTGSGGGRLTRVTRASARITAAMTSLAGVGWRRTLDVIGPRMTVTDHLTSAKATAVRISWLAGPGVGVTRNGRIAYLSVPGHGRYVMTVTGASVLAVGRAVPRYRDDPGVGANFRLITADVRVPAGSHPVDLITTVKPG